MSDNIYLNFFNADWALVHNTTKKYAKVDSRFKIVHHNN